MEDNEKPERGLEEISHLFLSRQSPLHETKGVTQREVQAGCGKSTPLANHTASSPAVKQNLCVLFSSKGLFAEKCFLVCNLAVKLASRNFSVGLIETNTTLPNAFFVLGSYFTQRTSKQSQSSSTETLSTLPPTLPNPEPPKLMEVPVGTRNKIKAVLFDKDLESDDSLTVLDRLNSESDFLIINAPPDVFRLKKIVSFIRPFFLVPVTVDPEKLLESYSLIKEVSGSMAHREVGLLIIEESHSQKAEGAFRIIAEMANKFLSVNIGFMGTIPIGADFPRSSVTRTPMLQEMGNSSTSRSIRKLANRLIKKIRSSERNHQW